MELIMYLEVLQNQIQAKEYYILNLQNIGFIIMKNLEQDH